MSKNEAKKKENKPTPKPSEADVLKKRVTELEQTVEKLEKRLTDFEKWVKSR